MSDDPAKSTAASAATAAAVEPVAQVEGQEQTTTPAAAAAAAAVPAPSYADGEYKCLCGKCGYTVTGAPVMAAFCHCNKCLAHVGSAFQAALYTPDNFAYKEGTEENLNKYESAPNKFRNSCKNCGSAVHNVAPNGLIIAALGGIKFKDNGVPVRPTMHIFTGDDDLTPILDDLPQFKEWPPM